MNEFGNGNLCTASSSTTSSQTSIAAMSSSHFKRLSDPWLHRQSSASNNGGSHDEDQMESQRRRSTGRYSLLDALDLEYALLRAAARGSVGPYSLSESIHKLTFTQSLAFPALARSITSKRRRSVDEHTRQRPLDPNESGLNLLAKFITACVLVLVSFLVFLIVYKFSTTWGLLLLSPTDSVLDDASVNDTDFSITSSTFNSNGANQSAVLYNSTSTHFNFQLYQRALLKRNQTLAEGFRRIYNMTYKP